MVRKTEEMVCDSGSEASGNRLRERLARYELKEDETKEELHMPLTKPCVQDKREKHTQEKMV
jgi:competence protein ComGC